MHLTITTLQRHFTSTFQHEGNMITYFWYFYFLWLFLTTEDCPETFQGKCSSGILGFFSLNIAMPKSRTIFFQNCWVMFKWSWHCCALRRNIFEWSSLCWPTLFFESWPLCFIEFQGWSEVYQCVNPPSNPILCYFVFFEQSLRF